MNDQDNFTALFAPEPAKPALPPSAAPWKVLLVDDEADIHAVLRLALQDILVEARALQLLDARSAAEAKARLAEHPDIALILLDVVMETEQAGLDLVRHIRQDLGNHSVQIVLVTGQPGYAPQREVVAEYAINGYRLKSELSADKIFVSVYAALRAHQALVDLEQQRRQLTAQTAALSNAEEKYRTVADYTYDWETWIAPDGSYRYISPACRRITGYRADEFVADSALMLRLVHQDDRAAMARHLESAHTASHLTERIEFRLITRAGAVCWIEHVCHSVLRDDGRYLGRRVSNRDITERKQAEAELARKTALLGERIKELDCLYRTSIVLDQPDKSEGEILEEAVQLIAPGWYYPDLACARIVIGESVFATENFRETPWTLSADIVAFGKTVGLVEVRYLKETAALDEGPFLKEEKHLIDSLAANFGATVERTRATTLLRASEARYRAVAQSAHDAIVTADGTGKIIGWNRGAETLFGYTAAEAMAIPLTALMPESYRDRHLGGFSRLISGGEPHLVGKVVELAGLRKNGGEFPIEVSLAHWDVTEGRFVTAIIRDITERKQAEATLQLIRFSVEVASDAFFWLTPDAGIADVNEEACRSLGYTREELLQLRVPDVDAHYNAEVWPLHFAELRQRGAITFESEHRTRDGRLFPVEIAANYVKYGDTERNCAFVRDITERKQAEAALKAREERFQLLFDGASDGIMIVSPSGAIIAANEAYARMHGYSVDEILAINLTELDTPRTRHLIGERMQRVLSGESITFEVEHYHKDGHVFALEVSASLIASGNEPAIQSFHRDITERKQAAEALRENELKYRALFETSSDAILLFADGRWVDCNVGALSVFGCTREQIIGAHPSRFSPPTQPDGRSSDEEAIKKINLAFTVGPQVFEWQHWRLDRTPFVAEVSLNRLDLGGKPHMQAIVRDINERKQFEKEKALLEAQFQQAQKMDSVGRLAGGVAHDFNNMLTVILGNVAMAIEQVDSAQPIHTDLVEIRKAATRSADLTRQLLAFARKQVVAPKVLDLNETVVGIIKMLQRLIGEDISLKWVPEANLWSVKIDPSQLDQILANLCINARDAIAGVGNIAIETGNSTFDEDYCAVHAGFTPGDYVRLAVSDNGHGIEKETLAHIFEPFFTTKGAGEGTGLGLATVYGAVKQNNGFINVFSEPDTGTTFTIYLPRHEGGPEQDSAAGAASTHVRGQETILLVEDEPSILKLTTRVLTRQGYAVLAANTPGEAIRLASEHASAIHLLMTDVVMPEMNGRDLAKILQSRSPGLKLLFMSGYTANIIVHQGVLDQGVQFIQKPFSIDDLAAKVRAVLESE